MPGVGHVLDLWLPSPDLSVARVRLRVESGGHDVPEAVIRRRFLKSVWNFERIYRPLASMWRLYDSSLIGVRPMIAEGAPPQRSAFLPSFFTLVGCHGAHVTVVSRQAQRFLIIIQGCRVIV